MRQSGAATASPSGRGSRSRTPAAGSRSARSAPAAAISRRTTCARCSGSVARARRSPSRCGSARRAGASPASPRTATSPSTWTTSTVSGRRPGAGARHSSSLLAGLALLPALLPQPAAGATSAGRVEPPRSPGPAVPSTGRRSRCRSRCSPSCARSRPDSDLFPDERVAGELIARLSELSTRLRQGADRGARRSLPCSPAASTVAACSRWRRRPSPARRRSRSSERGRWRRTPSWTRAPSRRSSRGCFEDFRQVTIAEFLITALTVDRERGCDQRRRALRPRRPGPDAWRVQRVGRWQLRWQRGPSGWRVVEWTAPERHPQQRLGPHLHRGHDGRLRRDRLVPAPAQHRLRRLGDDARLGARPRLERPPRRRGRRRRRRRARRRLRRPAVRVSQPAVPGPRRRHLRGRDGALRARHPGGHAARALRRRRQRRRPGPLLLAQLGSGPLPERRDRPLHPGPGRLPLRPRPAGCAHVDGDGRLRPRRLPRPLPVRLLLLLRRRRGEGGHAHALLRRDERPAQRASSATTATGGSSR